MMRYRVLDPDKKVRVREALGRMIPRLRPYLPKLLIAVVLALLAAALSVIDPRLIERRHKVFTGLVQKVQGRRHRF